MTGQGNNYQSNHATGIPEAIPVQQQQTQARVVYAQAATSVSASTPLEPRVVGSEAICRSCHRPFVRPQGCHDAQAQFYRCSTCITPKLQDFFGCVIC